MRKYTYLGAGAAALALLTAVSIAPALAAGGDELTAGGNNVNVGDIITASLSSPSAVFSTANGNITCTASAFSSTDATNPAEGGAPEATETVHALSFTLCKTNIPLVTSVGTIGLCANTAPVATVVDEPNDNPINLDVTPCVTVNLNTIVGPIKCIYSGNIVGVVSNTADTITFTNQTVTRQTGSAASCPATGTFSATYGNVKDISMTGSPAVIVN